MKNRKVIIIISILVLITVAIIVGVHKFYSSYMFNEDGTISGTNMNEFYEMYFEMLENSSGDDTKSLVDFGLQQGIITESEAKELLENKTTGKSDIKSNLFYKTDEYLKNEFQRVYTPYYEIISLEISDWNENDSGDEATFFYTMTFKNYYKDPETVDYIKNSKETMDLESYEKLKEDYLAPKELNFEFRINLENNSIELYSNAAPIGERWLPITIDEYVSSVKNEKLEIEEKLTNDAYKKALEILESEQTILLENSQYILYADEKSCDIEFPIENSDYFIVVSYTYEDTWKFENIKKLSTNQNIK